MDRALNKADEATEQRFRAINGYREQLAEQARTLMPRAEAEQRIAANAEKVEALSRQFAEAMSRSTRGSTWPPAGRRDQRRLGVPRRRRRRARAIIAIMSAVYGGEEAGSMHSFSSVRTALELADEELAGIEADHASERAGAAATLVAAHQAFTAEIEAERARTTTERARAEAEQARTGQVAAELDHLRAALVAGMARARVVEVPDTSAAGGSADVGGKLTTWLSSVVGPATIRCPRFGTYRVDDASVVVYAPQGITYDFNGSTLLRTRLLDQRLRYPNRHGFLRLMKPVDVTVQRLRVDGRVTNDGSMIAACEQVIDGRPHLTDQRGTPRSLDTQAGLLPPHWPVAGEWGVYCQALAFEHGIADGGGPHHCGGLLPGGDGGDGIGTTLDTTHDLTFRRSWCAATPPRHLPGRRLRVLLDTIDTQSARASIDIEPDTDRCR